MSKADAPAEEAAEAVVCLKDLVSQIKAGRLVDELGHDFRLNDAYLRALELLERIQRGVDAAVRASRR